MSSDQPITVSVEASTDEFCHVRVAGHFGWGADHEIRTRIADWEAQKSTCNSVVLDLSDVDFMDSAGISSLLTVHHEFIARGGKMILCDVPPRIGQVFDVVGMSRVIPIVENLRCAHEMFGQ